MGLSLTSLHVGISQNAADRGIVTDTQLVVEITRLTRTPTNEPGFAERAGIAPGDVLLGVNGLSVLGWSVKDVVDRISTAGDGPVLLTLLRPSSLHRLHVSPPNSTPKLFTCPPCPQNTHLRSPHARHTCI